MAEKKHFLAEIEEKLLDIWEKEKTFEKSLANRKGGELFSFYDGPPFANGTPHYGALGGGAAANAALSATVTNNAGQTINSLAVRAPGATTWIGMNGPTVKNGISPAALKTSPPLATTTCPAAAQG